MSTKDFFSNHSKLYAAFRPTYPEELYQFIFKQVIHFSCAWDCATGNGQAAQYLCKHFEKVYATDISSQQLEQAYPADNIFYSVSAAEKTAFADHQFDLITIGQALHWFNTDKFYQEVKRVAKPEGVLAVWGYTLPSVNADIDALLMNFYKNIVGPYWDDARKSVDEEYRNLPFPFEEIPSPRFFIKFNWNLESFKGYLESWSATQKYIKENAVNPVADFIKELNIYWPANELKAVSFPLFLKLTKIKTLSHH